MFLTYDESVSFLKEKIQKGELFAFSRFGDGEIAIMLERKWVEKRIREAWGMSDDNVVADIRKVLIDTLKQTDIVGILNPNEDNEHHLPFGFGCFLIPYEFLTANNIDLSKKIIMDHQFTRSREFGCLPNLKKIILDKPLHIISPYAPSVAAKFKDRMSNKIRFTQTSMKTEFINRQASLDIIKNNIHAEELVLYACGAGYKDLGVILKNSVGVSSIEVGATMDAWNGRLTRPWFAPGGLQEYLVLEE